MKAGYSAILHDAGQRAITVSLGSNDLGQLFIAGLLLAIAWILREGHRLQDENEAFV